MPTIVYFQIFFSIFTCTYEMNNIITVLVLNKVLSFKFKKKTVCCYTYHTIIQKCKLPEIGYTRITIIYDKECSETKGFNEHYCNPV